MSRRRQETFLEAARAIGDRICREALWDGDRCWWVDDALEAVGDDLSLVRGPIGTDVYSGVSGIALFLTRLYEASSVESYLVTAGGCMEHALSEADASGPEAHIGFYGGHGGIAYALAEFGQAAGEERYVEEALRLFREALAGDPARHGLDLVFGSAGVIPALLAVHRRCPRQFLIDLGIKYGEHLLGAARRGESGWSWNTLGDLNADRTKDLVGLSHGAAGIGWALLELSQVTGDERFREGAEGAFRYERHWFSHERENWPDLREYVGPKERFPVAWCHGAPGVGLSRLRAYELTGSDDYRSEAEAAIRTTERVMSRPLDGQNYSICHGVGGNADLLIYAGQLFGDAGLAGSAEAKAEEGIKRYGEAGVPWPCGTYWGGETLGLMQGLAGIGYFYLRLYDPARVPPVTLVVPRG